MVKVRPTLLRVPASVPGGRSPGTASLARNECPFGLLPAVARVLAAANAATSRYPDPHATGLVGALAAHLRVPADRIAVGAGSSEVCSQLLHTVVGPGDEVVFGWRSFEAYPILTMVAGGAPVRVPLARKKLDLDAMARAVTHRTRLIFVCNPNNPTATALDASALRAFADRVPTEVLIVVDEAYREYAAATAVPDALALLGDRPNVVVMRTFSKAYALAGLRVGYCVGPAELIAEVRKAQLPFSVGALAQDAAVAALGERAEVARRVGLTLLERERVMSDLHELGYPVPSSHTNFLWLPLREASSAFTEFCLNRGVAVRGFPGEGVRVTVGLAAENSAFLALAADWTAARRFTGR
ncbi:histidinol-phosphate transaminase [Streptacidiphilus rugosus]|uniref:histidinol-phosphate transaminase n=1 Tax=Streptacidiphilus rugosus TaxID=405783 RepID=UPI000A03ACDC|nr:histidinol-phosphate transaminase [Streptacidiphilus rugosus]